MHIKRVFWRFKEWILKGRIAPDLARKMLDLMSATPTISATTINNVRVEERVIREIHWATYVSESCIRMWIWIWNADCGHVYALDPLDPLGCWHLCILYHWPCWSLYLVLDSCAAKVITFPKIFFEAVTVKFSWYRKYRSNWIKKNILSL